MSESVVNNELIGLMKRTEELLDKLNIKIEKLIKEYGASNLKNTELANQVEDLKNKLDKKENENQQLKEQIKMIGLSGSVKNSGGSKVARSKINELVREIDKCIELINN